MCNIAVFNGVIGVFCSAMSSTLSHCTLMDVNYWSTFVTVSCACSICEALPSCNAFSVPLTSRSTYAALSVHAAVLLLLVQKMAARMYGIQKQVSKGFNWKTITQFSYLIHFFCTNYSLNFSSQSEALAESEFTFNFLTSTLSYTTSL